MAIKTIEQFNKKFKAFATYSREQALEMLREHECFVKLQNAYLANNNQKMEDLIFDVIYKVVKRIEENSDDYYDWVWA